LSNDEKAYKLSGTIEIKPEIKYKFEKDDVDDKTKKIRIGKYFKDTITINLALDAEEYYELLEFMQNATLVDLFEGLYLVFSIEDTNTSKAYPITTILELPKLGNQYNDGYNTTMKLESVHKLPLTHKPNFSAFGEGLFGDGLFGI
jgi:hypothetical protein